MSVAGQPAPTTWRTRPLADRDHDRWRSLYRGYATFYRSEQTDDQSETVWRWLLDESHPCEALVVVDDADIPVGLAHFRAFARPLAAEVGGYLDDLYVEPRWRGSGAVDSLLAALRAIAAERGWHLIRWITADDNYRARAKYDQVAERTAWVTYEIALPA